MGTILLWGLLVGYWIFSLKVFFSAFSGGSKHKAMMQEHDENMRDYRRMCLEKSAEMDWKAATDSFQAFSGDDMYVKAYRKLGTDYLVMWADSYERLLKASKW